MTTRTTSPNGKFATTQSDDEIEAELEAICAHVESGLFVKYACAEVGCSYERTRMRMREWDWYGSRVAKAVGRQAKQRLQRADDLESEGKSTKHQEWILEKLDPGQFGRAQQVELTGAEGGPVQSRLTITLAEAEAIAAGSDDDSE